MTDASAPEEPAIAGDPTTLPLIVGVIGTVEETGGAERAFGRIMSSFRDRLGCDIRVVSHIPVAADSEIAWTQPDLVLRTQDDWNPAKMVLRLRDFLKELPRPAILFPFQINSNIVASAANLLLPKSARLPCVFNDRANILMLTDVLRRGRGGAATVAAFRSVARFCYGRADYVIANAEANSEQIREFVGKPELRVDTIYNPLDAVGIQARFPARDRTSFLDPGGPLITTHGRLDPQKGFDILLEAFARVREKIPARPRIVGEGDERRALEAQAERLGIVDDLELPGFTADPLPLIEEGDVYVLPSRFEGLPNALLEGIAAGLPCIAADCISGPSEIIGTEGDDGLLIPVEDVEALTEALLTVLRDDARRQSLANAARRRAHDFSFDENTRRYCQIFAELGFRDFLTAAEQRLAATPGADGSL